MFIASHLSPLKFSRFVNPHKTSPYKPHQYSSHREAKTGSRHVFQLNLQKSPWCQLKTTQSSTCASSAMEPKQTMSNRAFLEHNTKLPNRCLSSSEMVSLCSVAASDFPYALLFDIASSKRLLTFNSLSELVLQAANASFLCIAVRADVLLEVEKYLPSSSSDSAVKLSQNFCRKSTNGDEVAHAFLQQKRLSDTLHQKCSRELLRL